MIGFDKQNVNALLTPQDWTFPISIAYGPGRLSEIGKKCANLGIQNPLIVTDKGSSNLPFIDELSIYLGQFGLKSKLYSGISPNPLEEDISEGKRIYHSGGHDACFS